MHTTLMSLVAAAGPLTVVGYKFMSKDAVTRGRDQLSMRYTPVPVDLPDAFDSRIQWPNCTTISDIWDQSACGDCWAVSTVTTASDRMCIGTNGATGGVRLSVEHMVGCCHSCGYGCGDGFPNYAWSWLAGGFGEPYGVVTGGQYQTTNFCSAYSLKPCNHYNSRNDSLPSCEGGIPAPTPTCPTACDADTTYKTPFARDIHKFKSTYALPADEAVIRADIFAHGPVTAGFNVYSDWVSYTSGVYQAMGGEEMGSHAVRIIGWGVEDGKKYWTVSNSFGEKWGDQGYFKILRGVSECGIESSVVAGLFV